MLSCVQDEAPLLTPNVLICSVGTEIFYRTADGSLQPDQAWEAYLDKGWDREAVQELVAKLPQLKPQVCSVMFFCALCCELGLVVLIPVCIVLLCAAMWCLMCVGPSTTG
jgi:hypothetical protein